MQSLSHLLIFLISVLKLEFSRKVSRVVPIFKAGDKKMCDNYRPISLESTIAKLLEKIVAIKLSNHLEININK